MGRRLVPCYHSGVVFMSKLEQMKDKRHKPTLKATIEENLQKVYQELLQEEVPDRFKLLLAELRQRQSALTEPEDGK